MELSFSNEDHDHLPESIRYPGEITMTNAAFLSWMARPIRGGKLSGVDWQSLVNRYMHEYQESLRKLKGITTQSIDEQSHKLDDLFQKIQERLYKMFLSQQLELRSIALDADARDGLSKGAG